MFNLSRRRPLSFRNQSINLLCKSMDWFLYNNGLRHERVKDSEDFIIILLPNTSGKTSIRGQQLSILQKPSIV